MLGTTAAVRLVRPGWSGPSGCSASGHPPRGSTFREFLGRDTAWFDFSGYPVLGIADSTTIDIETVELLASIS